MAKVFQECKCFRKCIVKPKIINMSCFINIKGRHVLGNDVNNLSGVSKVFYSISEII